MHPLLLLKAKMQEKNNAVDQLWESLWKANSDNIQSSLSAFKKSKQYQYIHQEKATVYR